MLCNLLQTRLIEKPDGFLARERTQKWKDTAMHQPNNSTENESETDNKNLTPPDFDTTIRERESEGGKGQNRNASSTERKNSTRQIRIEEHWEDRPPFHVYKAARIRLKGQWLQRAGFQPGARVEVRIKAAGLIELQTIDLEEA